MHYHQMHTHSKNDRLMEIQCAFIHKSIEENLKSKIKDLLKKMSLNSFYI